MQRFSVWCRNRAYMVSVHFVPSLPSTANKYLKIQQNHTTRAAPRAAPLGQFLQFSWLCFWLLFLLCTLEGVGIQTSAGDRGTCDPLSISGVFKNRCLYTSVCLLCLQEWYVDSAFGLSVFVQLCSRGGFSFLSGSPPHPLSWSFPFANILQWRTPAKIPAYLSLPILPVFFCSSPFFAFAQLRVCFIRWMTARPFAFGSQYNTFLNIVLILFSGIKAIILIKMSTLMFSHNIVVGT